MNMNKKEIINALILSSAVEASSLIISLIYKEPEILSSISHWITNGSVILVICNFITLFFTKDYLVNPLLLMLLVVGFYIPIAVILLLF